VLLNAREACDSALSEEPFAVPRILLCRSKRCVDQLRAAHVGFAPPPVGHAYREPRGIGVDEGLKLMGPVANIDLMGKQGLGRCRSCEPDQAERRRLWPCHYLLAQESPSVAVWTAETDIGLTMPPEANEAA
jgi:hypothetical protein